MEVHTTIQYGQKDYTEQTKGDTSNNDGNRTEVTVPYAKEFTLTAQMKKQAVPGGVAQLEGPGDPAYGGGDCPRTGEPEPGRVPAGRDQYPRPEAVTRAVRQPL